MPTKKRSVAVDRDAALREHLLALLHGGHAHADFDTAVRNLAPALRGKRPKGAEHSPWELLEHLRIAQGDILEFSRDAKHKSPDWPSGYWPATAAPPNDKAWDKSVRAFRRDLKAMCDLVRIQRPICSHEFRTGTGRRFCARRCWPPTTTHTIWASWCWCAGCWGHGSEAVVSDRLSGDAG